MYMKIMLSKLYGKLVYNFCIYKKGLYIKIGQILSTQKTIFSDDFIAELVQLQHNIPHNLSDEEYITIKELIHTDISNVEIVDSGSIAIILKGKLKCGKCVAIKVIRPGIKELLTKQNNEINYMLNCISGSDKYKKKWKRVYMSLLKQVDMQQEMENLSTFRSISDYVIIPEPYNQYSTDTVLVMDWIDGSTLDSIDRLTMSVDEQKSMGSKFAMFVNDTYSHGWYHMDLHPGNILITGDNKLAIIDFGLVANVEVEKSKKILKCIISLNMRQYETCVDMFIEVYLHDCNDIHIRQNLIDYCNSVAKTEPDTSTFEQIRNIYKICEESNIIIDDEFSDMELAFVTAKDVFTMFWDMESGDFYSLME